MADSNGGYWRRFVDGWRRRTVENGIVSWSTPIVWSALTENWGPLTVVDLSE